MDKKLELSERLVTLYRRLIEFKGNFEIKNDLKKEIYDTENELTRHILGYYDEDTNGGH